MARYNHGLQGRERYLYHREREDRLFQRQLLDDFFEPERTRRPARRFVPIRRRAEFVAETVALATPADFAARTTSDSRTIPAMNQGRFDKRPDSAIRFNGRPAEVHKAQKLVNVVPAIDVNRPVKPGFSWRGFLTGCAMGGMAAAVALLVLNTLAG